MTEINEMQTYLKDVSRVITQTQNLIGLINKGSSDEGELLRECSSNIEWANKDLQKVKVYLNPVRVVH